MPFRFESVTDQRDSLKKIRALIKRGSISPKVRQAAVALTRDCAGRDDQCEIEAIFNAVKHGDDRVDALKDGFRYVADPHSVDWFQGAEATLKLCEEGACGSDCDDHTILVGALLASLGFMVGARAWGPNPRKDAFTHVYCVVALPKRGPWPKNYHGTGMDTSSDESYVGWEPQRGRIMTAWID